MARRYNEWSSHKDAQKVANFFRHWKKALNLESKRYKLTKYRNIFKKLQDNIFNGKI